MLRMVVSHEPESSPKDGSSLRLDSSLFAQIPCWLFGLVSRSVAAQIQDQRRSAPETDPNGLMSTWPFARQ